MHAPLEKTYRVILLEVTYLPAEPTTLDPCDVSLQTPDIGNSGVFG